MYLSIDQYATKYGLTRQTVSKLIKAGEINAEKIGKQYRIREQSLSLQEPELFYIPRKDKAVLNFDKKQAELDIIYSEDLASIVPVIYKHENIWNSLYQGENSKIMRTLLHDLAGKIDLVYIDPPYNTGDEFHHLEKGFAYSDKFTQPEFLYFLRERLVLIRELLSEKGSIYIHIDKKIGHYVKVLADEIFGFDNFINDITRIKCNPKNFGRQAYGNQTDMILFYAKKKNYNIWNNVSEELDVNERANFFKKWHPKHGYYTTHPIHAPGETRNGDTGEDWMGMSPPPGRHWRYSRAELDRLNAEGLIEWSPSGNPRKIVFAKDHSGKKIQDVWEFKDSGLSRSHYPTQKNLDLLNRIVEVSSNEDSIVMDCFCGSGTTIIAAEKLKRRWIGIDESPLAITVSSDRLNELNSSFNSFRCNQPSRYCLNSL